MFLQGDGLSGGSSETTGKVCVSVCVCVCVCVCVSTAAVSAVVKALKNAPRAMAGDRSWCSSTLMLNGEASCRHPQSMTPHCRYDGTFKWSITTSCVLSGSMDVCVAGLTTLTCTWSNRIAVLKWVISVKCQERRCTRMPNTW